MIPDSSCSLPVISSKSLTLSSGDFIWINPFFIHSISSDFSMQFHVTSSNWSSKILNIEQKGFFHRALKIRWLKPGKNSTWTNSTSSFRHFYSLMSLSFVLLLINHSLGLLLIILGLFLTLSFGVNSLMQENRWQNWWINGNVLVSK